MTRDWITAVSMPSEIAPLVPPPVRPVPAVTPVMSPLPTVSLAHTTVPSWLTPVTKLPAPQVPATRVCTLPGSKPSSVVAVPARTAYGTLVSGMRGISTSPLTTSCAYTALPSNTCSSSPLFTGSIEPRFANTRPRSATTVGWVSSQSSVPPSA